MSEIFDETIDFAQMGLRSSVLRGITASGFEHPTDIQAKLIPLLMAGRDALGQARTGTGKTAAFGLPILHKADPNVPMQALILAPTRELAAQVASELEELGRFTPIRTTCIIGGESMKKQVDSVKRGTPILVGTPGRIMDLLGRRDIHLNNVRFVVLDEVDRMLDIGFRDDIKKILSGVKTEHQTVFVSATIGSEIESLARTFMKQDAEKVVAVTGALTVSEVDQKYLPVEPWDKRALLLHLLRHEKPDMAVVFCRTKVTVDKLSSYLRKKNIPAQAIHGDLTQGRRNLVMTSLRKGELNVLIASDLAARGLDVEHISHVINYDLPDDPEVYIHRVGRTARVGRRGTAWAFVSPEEGQRLTEIEKLAGVMIERFDFPSFEPGPVPDDVREQRQREERRADPTKTLSQRTALPDLDGLSEEEMARMFPGGVVPKSVPRRTLGSRLRSRRSR